MHSWKILFVFFFFLYSSVSGADEVQSMPEGVMATRGQGVVTPAEFDATVSKIPAGHQAAALRDPERVRTILANILLTSQLAADARDEEFGQADSQIELRMKMAAETEFANAWLEHKVNSAPDADYVSMAREYYLLNPKDFEVGPRVDVTHLLVSNKERTTEEAKLLAESYLEKINADPSDFDELVKLYSEDPSVLSNGGRFTEVKIGTMVKPFETAAFSLENTGDFSELVKTRYGYHIIRLDKTHPSYILPYEEVAKRIEQAQAKEHRERVRMDYLTALASEPTNISDEEIVAMIGRYFDLGELQPQSPPPDKE
ncbi:MAG: peptidylprolyl isomerase [Xanthomonadales bacterium]|nr:peptidylprolyl isomerase [Xanthomonadales bacterium]